MLLAALLDPILDTIQKAVLKPPRCDRRREFCRVGSGSPKVSRRARLKRTRAVAAIPTSGRICRRAGFSRKADFLATCSAVAQIEREAAAQIRRRRLLSAMADLCRACHRAALYADPLGQPAYALVRPVG